MDVDIRYSPSFALAVITLPPGGEVKAEAGAMTSMSGGVEIETRAQGGLLKGLKRSVLGGESFFINTLRACPCRKPRPPHATRRYSLIRPPTRACLRTRH